MENKQKRTYKDRRSILAQEIEVSPSEVIVKADLMIRSPESLQSFSSLPIKSAAPALIKLAAAKGLQMVAITDRHSVNFIDSVQSANLNQQLIIIPGVEVRTQIGDCDDVSLICLFPETYRLPNLNLFLRKLNLTPKSQACELPVEKIIEECESFGGAIFPSRVDLTPTRLSILPNLIELGFRIFDVAYLESTKMFQRKWPEHKILIYSFSNASALAQVGCRVADIPVRSRDFIGLKHFLTRQGAEFSAKSETISQNKGKAQSSENVTT